MMDSPVVSQLFRQLFRHQSSLCCHRSLRGAIQHGRNNMQRRLVSSVAQSLENRESHWQTRREAFPEDKLNEYKRYPTVTSNDLKARKERPRRVKMRLREFIEGWLRGDTRKTIINHKTDSLYNPNYGYFSKHATIFSPGDSFEFRKMRDEREFYRILGDRYTTFEDKLDEKNPDEARQLWHTPTELFRPYYGESIARYLVTNYKLTLYPYHDLILYEMGAGNGTMMLNILDYIRDVHPEVYERTQYKIIEISPALASLQNRNLRRSALARGHASRVEIINKSIFEWDTYVSSPCFFLALEVFDNFAHDALRYDVITKEPLQANVLIDSEGEFYEYYTRELDPIVSRFLRVRNAACNFPYNYPLRGSELWRYLRSYLPNQPHLTTPEYIPTRLMQFFDVLYNHFPGHKLVTSDFHSLPDAVEGVNAPVVQTRYQRKTVPVTTPLVSVFTTLSHLHTLIPFSGSSRLF